MFGAFTPALLLAWNSSQVREPSPLDSPAPIFVINLEARYDKWRATVDSTLNAGLRNARLVRWPGVFFNRSTADERTVGWLSRPAQRGKWSQLDLGMAGLRLAHVSAWNEIATTRSDDEYAIIVEDDIEFLRHSFACTAQCVAAAGAFDVINLRAIRPSGTPVAGAPGMLRVEKLKWPGKTPFLCIDHVDIAMANTLMFDPKASFYSVGDAICFGGRDAGSDRKHLVAGDSFNQSLRDEVAASMARGLARGMAQQPKSYFCRAPPCDGGEAEAGGGASASPHGRRLAGFVSKC